MFDAPMNKVISALVLLMWLDHATPLSIGRDHFPSRERFNFFDRELFRVLSKTEEKNVVISPVSVKLLLGLLLEGAAGSTAEEINLALRLPKPIEAARREFDNWLSLLREKKSSSVLNLSSHVFLSDKLRVKPEYEVALNSFYGANITAVKFDERIATTQIINDWVSEQTFGLIPSLIRKEQVEADSNLMLISAVYFKGLWMSPFHEVKRPKCFYTSAEKCQKTSMMSATGYYNFGYVDELDSQALQIPYKDKMYFMLILLPSKQDGIDELIQDLVHVSIKAVVSETELQEIYVQIPKFEITYENNLVESLKKCELSGLFSRNANFSNISSDFDGRLTVDGIFHSARIKVDEEGSEASAASGALFKPLMGGTTTSFVANHPFLFFIVDSKTYSILFAGKVMSPATAKRLGPPRKSEKEPVLDAVVKVTNSPASEVDHSSQSGPIIRKSAKLRSMKETFFERNSLHPLPPSASDIVHSAGQEKDFHKRRTATKLTSKEKEFSGLEFPLKDPLSEPKKLYAENKRPKAFDGLKSFKKIHPTSDSWRHHILFFN